MNSILSFVFLQDTNKDPNIGRDPNRVPIPHFVPPSRKFDVKITTFAQAKIEAEHNFNNKVREIEEARKNKNKI